MPTKPSPPILVLLVSLVAFATIAVDANWGSFALGSLSAVQPPPDQADGSSPTLGNYLPTTVTLGDNIAITPDAPPANATSVTAQTSSGFIGQLTADPATGIVRLTNAHLAGSYNVTVTAFGDGGTASRTFALTVTSGAACNQQTYFTSPTVPSVPVGSWPNDLAVGDFNNDGIQDVITANRQSNNVSIRLGDGGGFISPAIPEVAVTNRPNEIAIGDFNGDGNQDFAVTDDRPGNLDNHVVIRLGDGMGGFTSPAVPEIAIGSGPMGIAVGDFNNDGRDDLAITTFRYGVLIRLGDGSGGFTLPLAGDVQIAWGTSIVLGDFNNDGFQDFATSDGNTVFIRLGDGSGGFTSPATPEIVVGAYPRQMAIGDFNADGNQDFAVVLWGTNKVAIRLGDGTGGFTSPATPEIIVGPEPFSIAAADFNNDGNQDLAVGYNSSGNVSIRLGNGSGGFTLPLIPELNLGGDHAQGVAIGDFNGDGIQDFVATDLSNSFAVRLGACSAVTPTNTTTPTPTFTPTPSNHNAITAFDAALVSRYTRHLESLDSNQYAAADVSGNGVVSTWDMQHIGYYVAGLSSYGFPNSTGTVIDGRLMGDVSGAGPHFEGSAGTPALSLPAISATPGAITIPVSVADLTGLGVIAYEFQVSFDPAVLQPTSGGTDNTGTLSSNVGVFCNTSNPGHIIVEGIGSDPLVGSGILVNLKFNVIGAGGQFTGLTFEDYLDPLARNHQSFFFNEGKPSVSTTNGSVTVAIPTATSTPTSTATATATNTPTSTSTATNTATPVNTPISTLGSYPDRSILLSTNTTVVPDAPPTSTARINVSTDSNFKGRLEADPLTGAVRVTNAHPSGIYSMTVRAFDAAGASAVKTFSISVVTPTTCNPVSFRSPSTFSTGDYGRGSAVGDFNGDGIQDVVTANEKSLSISILLGDGTGGFSSITTPLAGIPTAIAVDEINGDGKQDLVITSSGHVLTLLGDGTGSFNPAVDIGTVHNPLGVTAGDLNNDGRRDIIVVNSIDAGNVSVFLADGAGGFSAATSFAAGPDPEAAVIGDFNHDGKQDLAVANWGGANVAILLGNGAGGFSAPLFHGAGLSPTSVTVGDFNDDKNQDIAVANETSGNISILLGDGAGGFSDPTYFPAGGGAISVAVGDFNGDKEQDLAVANRDSGTVSLLFGDGMGSFGAPIDLGVGVNPLSILVGDFDGNGEQDLASVNNGSSNISVLLRNCALTPGASISGTVTYGNAIPPGIRFVSNAVITGVGSPTVTTTTGPPGPAAGQYTLTGFGAGSYNVTPAKTGDVNSSITSFDAAKIAQHATGVNSLTGNQLIVADVSGDGTISSFDAGQLARYVATLPGSGTAGNWKFIPASRTYASVTTSIVGEDYSALLMGEVSGNWTETGAKSAAGQQRSEAGGPERPAAVELPGVTAAGKEIAVPVKVHGVAKRGVISYEFDLRYDPSVIRPEAVDLTNTISRRLKAVVNSSEAGRLRVVVYGATPIMGDGVLLKLRFVAVGKPGAVSPLVWERFMFNEGEPGVSAIDGQVVLSEPKHRPEALD